MRVSIALSIAVWPWLAACSSAGGDPSSGEDSAVVDDDAGAIDSAPDHANLPEISIDTSDAPSHDAAGDCPACQASKCLPELEACAASATCPNWLMCMNDCFGASDPAACQAECAKRYPSKQADAMLACNDAKCHVECTP